MRSFNLQGSAPIHPSTPAAESHPPEKLAADVLAGQICHAAALAAQSESALLELIGEFDASDAIRWWVDLKSVAHWLSWACSMTPGTAREHVRVAKALRNMPTVAAAFAEGRLSYSKVREVTRVVNVIDEAKLCELALTATASQLARMIRGYRTADGLRLPQETKRQASWHRREDGMVDVRAQLPAEEAAIVIAAIAAAKDRNGVPPSSDPPRELRAEATEDPPRPSTRYTNADALLDLARAYLETVSEDRSGEDRTLVVVHVSADTLADNVPAGTPATPDTDTARPEGVPAGTSVASAGSLQDGICHVAGVGPLAAETARRLACDADLVGAVVDAHGDVLDYGRTRRLVSKVQRRALMIRDGMCRFPGCHQTRHLKAHHIISWFRGGPTDLDNLILLCQWHHTAVHEGGMTIRRVPALESHCLVRFEFRLPDGRLYPMWSSVERLPYVLNRQFQAITGFNDPLAKTIRPRWSGERPDLHACVEALFGMKRPAESPKAVEPAAA